MKKKYLFAIVFSVIALLLFLLVSCFVLLQHNKELKTDLDKTKVELAHASITSPMQVDSIRGSIPVPVSPVTEIDKSTYKKKLADKQLLKELNIKSSQVEQQQRTESIVKDTVKLNDFSYKDKWAEFHVSLADSTLSYSVRDSVTTIIYREYKHRFLWLKWGTKGYKIKVVNFNPHSTLLYNQYIKIDH